MHGFTAGCTQACLSMTALLLDHVRVGAVAGNHAFARQYNKAVPDTWGLINDQASCPLRLVTHTRRATS